MFLDCTTCYQANRPAPKRHRGSEQSSRAAKDWYLKARYGIPLDTYEAMAAAQDGTCSICRRPPQGIRGLAVDHDHSSGAVRALLCTTCNAGLGSFHDDVSLLFAAAAYLLEHDPTALTH